MNKQQFEKQQFTALVRALAIIAFAALAFGCFGTNPLTRGDSWSNANNSSGTSSVDLSTPAKAYAAYRQALKSKDLNLYKKVISKEILDIKSENAKRQNKSLDDFLRETGMPYVGDNDKSRNETINGDKATLEVSSDGDSWGKLEFVKESDGWKMDSRSRRDEKEADNIKPRQ